MSLFLAEGAPGCNPPDIRVTKPRRHSVTTTTSPILTFETTQIYLPDDFTAGDLEFIHNNKQSIRAAFRNGKTGELLVDDVGVNDDDLSLHYVNYSPVTWNDEKKNFEHSKAPSKRTRRAAISFPSSSLLKLQRDSKGVLTISAATAADGRNKVHRSVRPERSLSRSDDESERIYIQSTDLVSSLQQSPTVGAASASRAYRRPNGTGNADYEDNQIRATNRTNDDNDGDGRGPSSRQLNLMQNASGNVFAADAAVQHPEALTPSNSKGDTGNGLRRVKRKSGKTTGALSRPKSDSGSSSSKSTSRKTQCKFLLLDYRDLSGECALI